MKILPGSAETGGCDENEFTEYYKSIALILLERDPLLNDLSNEGREARILAELPQKIEHVRWFARTQSCGILGYQDFLKILQNILCLVEQNISFAQIDCYPSFYLYTYSFRKTLSTLNISASQLQDFNCAVRYAILRSPENAKILADGLGISAKELCTKELKAIIDEREPSHLLCILEKPTNALELVRIMNKSLQGLLAIDSSCLRLMVNRSEEIVKLVTEYDISFHGINRSDLSLLHNLFGSYGEFRERNIDQKAEMLREHISRKILYSIIDAKNLSSGGEVYSGIYSDWKKTRSSSVVSSKFFCCGVQSDAEVTYRSLQKLFRDNPISSRQRELSALFIMHEFTINPNNQNDPFAVALKNRFNLSEIKREDILEIMATETRTVETSRLALG